MNAKEKILKYLSFVLTTQNKLIFRRNIEILDKEWLTHRASKNFSNHSKTLLLNCNTNFEIMGIESKIRKNFLFRKIVPQGIKLFSSMNFCALSVIFF